ncbi:RNA-binding protein 5-A-like [Calliphora vicina]|uniref:RNA-binding protein 5-A-like n=1 Tax=Calliphora vicina TaxID=7373 RepID=UPI00325B60C5
MDRRSRSISPRRYRNGGNGGGGGYRRYSRSRSRSRDRGRELNYRNKRNTRSRSRDRNHRRGNSNENDLYRDIINQDYQEERNYGGNGGGGYSRGGGGNNNNYRSRNNDDDYMDDRDHYWNDNRSRDKGRDQERDYDNRDRRDNNRRYGGNGNNGNNHNNRRYNSADRDSDDSDETMSGQYYNKTPSNTIIVLGLQSHITEADIMSFLIQMGMAPASIRLIRKRTTGASRGFAFVEFNTVDEAAHWMELTQGALQLQETCRATLQYSHSLQSNKTKTNPTDWYCGKCGMFNFKRRDSCFKCYASREESERGGEGSDEISNILTKKIMLRNLDVLTNEEGVLTAITVHAPDIAKKISKVLVSRDALTQTSRGICYLHFESLVDSMNMHNLLSTLEPPLKIDNKEVVITYCIDQENRQIVPKKIDSSISSMASGVNQSSIGPLTAAEMASVSSGGTGEYTLADVPRLAEYSASMYANTPAEHAHYLQYYTDYYISEITKGSYSNLPTDSQMTEANSGAAVALSAIQRKQRKMNSIETTATAAATAAASAAAAAKASLATRPVVTPKGNDGKVYPTPDVSLYQYDETSGYYYDPTTGLYYDAHSQYYYNNETGAYLYWDQRKSSYVLATPAAAAASVQDVVKQETDAETKSATTAEDDSGKKEKKESSGNKHDKVKVAKKIVKDMEKWAKQLNQKKDYTVVATPQPILTNNRTEDAMRSSTSGGLSSGYADVGFSILEKKTAKLNASNTFMSPMSLGSASTNKLIPSYGSDSDEDNLPPPPKISAATSAGEMGEKEYVDFQKLTCLLCKRAFQSLEILQKHLKMSNLHKENLAKHNIEKGLTVQQQQQQQQAEQDSLSAALSYRDRAKERRLKYGESDPPPPNRSRERFEKEINNLTSRQKQQDTPALPIGSNNVGNRLLQKMGWSEGQGLGRKNQGRTNIIEANARNTTAGLGTKAGIGPGDDYKSYIKKMMKSRYESV